MSIGQSDDSGSKETPCHVVVDIELRGVGGAGAVNRCAVCVEPPQWAAIGRCSHRAVCPACMGRIRLVDRDMLCNLCRTECPSAVVVRGDCAAAVLAELPPSRTREGRIGNHVSTPAYSTNEQQHVAARDFCEEKKIELPPSGTREGCTGNHVNTPAVFTDETQHEAPRDFLEEQKNLIFMLLFYITLATMGGVIGSSFEQGASNVWLKVMASAVGVVIGLSIATVCLCMAKCPSD